MNLTVTFESAELQFMQILEEFFVSVYDEKSLASHGIEHHRRVWNFAKEIVVLFSEQNLISDPTIVFRLIIACYLHDIGMSVDPGIRHGHHSKDLCIRFLDNNLLDKSNYQDVLLAIENHDNKEYKTSAVNNDLLTILSVADDLDALGFLGIYRYSEIYLTRGINPGEIGHLIRENASKRFENFVKIFGFSEEFVRKHQKRYEILDNFFSEYSNQVVTYKFGTGHPVGYCGVIELLIDTINNRFILDDVCDQPKKYSPDPIAIWFFKELLFESISKNTKVITKLHKGNSET